MNEFDKWNSKQKRVVPSNTGRFHTLVDFERRVAWKAALQWARDNAGGDSSDSRDVYGDIVKELESAKT